MKWDHTTSRWNKRTSRWETVREAYFQDENDAITLADRGGKTLTVRDHGDRLLAIAKHDRAAKQWICTRYDVEVVDGKHKRTPVYAFHATKDAAIDFLLGRDVLPGI